MKTEPAVTIGAILAVINAGLALLIGFGVNVSQEQAALIVGLANAALALASSWITRRKVTPVADGAMPADT